MEKKQIKQKIDESLSKGFNFPLLDISAEDEVFYNYN